MGLAPKFGLVLSGGGARGSYQAGVLEAIAEIIGNEKGDHPFSVITGISAGAINASSLAGGTKDFSAHTKHLTKLWNELSHEEVMRTDISSLSKIGFGWIKDLSFGGLSGKSESTFLVDSSPLRKLIDDNVSFDKVHENIQSKKISGLGITTTSYGTGTSITFFDSLEAAEWSRSSRIGLKEKITTEHILASSSIPFLFKPIKLDNNYFGDGGIRSNTPFSPAIHLGADRILAIGVRYMRSTAEVRDMNLHSKMDNIVLSDIAETMFHSVFLDAIEFDYERLMRINQTIDLISEEVKAKQVFSLKKIPALVIQPSVDLGALAAEEFDRFPRMMKYLLSGIGASRDRGADLLSYIAFDKAYTSKLVEIGYKDGMTKKEEIRKFFDLK
ncbi:MAG: patatin-like phospholipase family protein [Rhizobacter sp.]|nr:patatin-like phospholipase family protein [Bacteriovorax sp.]